MSTLERPAELAIPSELEPEEGFVSVCGVLLLNAQRWQDEGAHFIRSTEAEVWGQGDDLQEAVGEFVSHAIELLHHLATQVREVDATEHETQVHALLGERIADVMAAIEESETRRRDAMKQLLGFRRRKFREANTWRRAPLTPSRPHSLV